jgi:NAD(P)-dependent dehydrogenase (short-subunit alcohol dehydrogenase family)
MCRELRRSASEGARADTIAAVELDGRSALVTGTSRGIGPHIASGLAKLGARVLCHARREEDARGRAAEVGGVPVWGDLAGLDGVRSLASQVAAEAPALAVLVHNAGVLHRGRIDDTTPDDFADTLDVNVRAPFFLTQALLPQLRAAAGARVVVVSSRAGAMNEGMSGGSMAYRISKAAVNAFACNLAAELAPDGILVNAMHPGWVRTDMGGRSAAVAPEDGADTAIFLATLPDGGPSGKFWFERREIDF